jgi:hypothetical protein
MYHHLLVLLAVLAALGGLTTAAKTTTTATTTTTTTIAPCATTAWSTWASCNGVDCLAGTEARVREFINPADNGKSECGELSQIRCVTGECLGALLSLYCLHDVIDTACRAGVHDD